MTLKKSILLLFSYVSFTANCQGGPGIPGYDLEAPDQGIVLPALLSEISGITHLGGSRFACVQDEYGAIYIFDIAANKLEREILFSHNGDYEGIAVCGSTIYVLRSDGVLFEIQDFDLPGNTVMHDTGVPADDSEGLCYDKSQNRLLIACKSAAGKEKEEKKRRLVYEFDLKNKTLNPEPAFILDGEELSEYASKNKELKDVKALEKETVRFLTSEIAIHPLSGDIYLLAAEKHLLLVLDKKGKIKHLTPLDPVIFNKSEGIAFFENGDMVISNEGEKLVPTIYKFSFRP